MSQASRVWLIISLIGVGAAGSAAQEMPPLIHFEGQLYNAMGEPTGEGEFDIEFRLWNTKLPADPGQRLIWGQRYRVQVHEGEFLAVLGAGGGLPLEGAEQESIAHAFGESARYLGLTVVAHEGVPEASPAEIVPRQQILSVPYAFRAQRTSDIPAGTIVPYAGSIDPGEPGSAVEVQPGWLWCNGATVSANEYPDLGAAILTLWGDGDSDSEADTNPDDFQLPDLRGLFLRGVDAGAGNDPDVNSRTPYGAGAAQDVGTRQEDELKSHTHPLGESDGNDSDGAYVDSSKSADSPSTRNDPIRPTGGNETRPKNASIHYLIRY